MYVYTHIYTYMYLYIHTYIYIYKYIQTFIYKEISFYMNSSLRLQLENLQKETHCTRENNEQQINGEILYIYRDT
jgi:hypothetical protein